MFYFKLWIVVCMEFLVEWNYFCFLQIVVIFELKISSVIVSSTNIDVVIWSYDTNCASNFLKFIFATICEEFSMRNA